MSVVTDTTIKSEPTPEALPVMDFSFRFLGDAVEITLWPTLGDTYEKTDTEYIFRFQRLGVEQTVFRSMMAIGVTVKIGTRVPFDIEEFKRKAEAKKNVQASAAR